jgi:hypothetical protein
MHVVKNGIDQVISDDDPRNRAEQLLRRRVTRYGIAFECGVCVGTQMNTKPSTSRAGTRATRCVRIERPTMQHFTPPFILDRCDLAIRRQLDAAAPADGEEREFERRASPRLQ